MAKTISPPRVDVTLCLEEFERLPDRETLKVGFHHFVVSNETAGRFGIGRYNRNRADDAGAQAQRGASTGSISRMGRNGQRALIS